MASFLSAASGADFALEPLFSPGRATLTSRPHLHNGRAMASRPRRRGGRRMITVTDTDKAADPSAPPAPRKDWRFYAGMTAMALAVIMPLTALVVPVLGLSTTQSALLAGVLLAGGPEVLCILAVALLGKETFLYFAHRAKTALRRAVIDQPASKARYYTGLVVILVSWLPAYIYAYSPALMPQGDARIYLLAAMDLAFVVSVFLMGGEFWEKVRRIFVYEGKI
jgi:hypothetical protein